MLKIKQYVKAESLEECIDGDLCFIRQMMIIDILCHTADSVSAHLATGTIRIVHIHLEICFF